MSDYEEALRRILDDNDVRFERVPVERRSGGDKWGEMMHWHVALWNEHAEIATYYSMGRGLALSWAESDEAPAKLRQRVQALLRDGRPYERREAGRLAVEGFRRHAGPTREQVAASLLMDAGMLDDYETPDELAELFPDECRTDRLFLELADIRHKLRRMLGSDFLDAVEAARGM